MTAIDPVEQVRAWLDEARAGEPCDADAAALATVDPHGAPSVRMVLVRGLDARGFVFYTNLGSAKAADLQQNPRAALCLYWKSLQRQVRIEGRVEPVADDEADAYFAGRPHDSQIGAWASKQSQPMGGRFELEKRVAQTVLKFPTLAVPRPPFWSGFRVVPQRIEFWRQRPFRLHERILYERAADGWRSQLLYP